jgi:hypothetical protein
MFILSSFIFVAALARAPPLVAHNSETPRRTALPPENHFDLLYCTYKSWCLPLIVWQSLRYDVGYSTDYGPTNPTHTLVEEPNATAIFFNTTSVIKITLYDSTIFQFDWSIFFFFFLLSVPKHCKLVSPTAYRFMLSIQVGPMAFGLKRLINFCFFIHTNACDTFSVPNSKLFLVF